MSCDELHQFTSLAFTDAVLCANCERVSNSPNECLCCGSTATIALASLLGTLEGGSTARMIEPEWNLREIPKIMPRRAA